MWGTEGEEEDNWEGNLEGNLKGGLEGEEGEEGEGVGKEEGCWVVELTE